MAYPRGIIYCALRILLLLITIMQQAGIPEAISKQFLEKEVDGSILLSLTDSDLKNEFTIPFGVRKKLNLAIKKVVKDNGNAFRYPLRLVSCVFTVVSCIVCSLCVVKVVSSFCPLFRCLYLLICYLSPY